MHCKQLYTETAQPGMAPIVMVTGDEEGCMWMVVTPSVDTEEDTERPSSGGEELVSSCEHEITDKATM